MRRIVVTGGSGGAGRHVVRHLLEKGYEVRNLDVTHPAGELCPFVKVDLTDYGATFAAMHGADGVVHFGSSPHPDFDFVTGAERFRNNTLATYNVFQAAVALGMKRVVWASSETVLGFPFDNVRPEYLPVDEAHPLLPQSSYALSKVACEELARRMSTLYGLSIVALRFSNILYTDTAHPANYEAIPSYWLDPFIRKFNLWGYVDARDAAVSVRQALEADIDGADEMIVAAADTIMNRPNRELVEAVFPGVPIKAGAGEHDTLLSIEKARRVLGFEPEYSWRTVLPEDER